MSEYLFLKLNKEVSVNPEYAPVNPDSLVQTDKKPDIAKGKITQNKCFIFLAVLI